MMLVTGFGPYQELSNASGVLVQFLNDDFPEDLAPLQEELAFEVITCDDTSRETEHLSLHLAQAGGYGHKASFIHVRLLPQQVITHHHDCPYIPLEMSRRVLSIAIRQVAEARV